VEERLDHFRCLGGIDERNAKRALVRHLGLPTAEGARSSWGQARQHRSQISVLSRERQTHHRPPSALHRRQSRPPAPGCHPTSAGLKIIAEPSAVDPMVAERRAKAFTAGTIKAALGGAVEGSSSRQASKGGHSRPHRGPGIQRPAGPRNCGRRFGRGWRLSSPG
jgi:hypothetical protein